MKPFNFGGRNSLKLSISRSLLLIRDVYSTKVPFGALIVWYKATSACTSGSASTNDQIQPLTLTDLILRTLIRQTPTNRSEVQCFLQFNTMFCAQEYWCRVVKN